MKIENWSIGSFYFELVYELPTRNQTWNYFSLLAKSPPKVNTEQTEAKAIPVASNWHWQRISAHELSSERKQI